MAVPARAFSSRPDFLRTLFPMVTRDRPWLRRAVADVRGWGRGPGRSGSLRNMRLENLGQGHGGWFCGGKAIGGGCVGVFSMVEGGRGEGEVGACMLAVRGGVSHSRSVSPSS